MPITDTSLPPRINLGFRRLISLFFILDYEVLMHRHQRQDPDIPPTPAAHS